MASVPESEPLDDALPTADASADASADSSKPLEKHLQAERFVFRILDDNMTCIAVVRIGNGATNRQMRVATYYTNSEKRLKSLTNPTTVYRVPLTDLPITAERAWMDMSLTVNCPRDATHYAFYHALRYFFDDLIALLPRTDESGAYTFNLRKWRELLTSSDVYHRTEAFLELLPASKA